MRSDCHIDSSNVTMTAISTQAPGVVPSESSALSQRNRYPESINQDIFDDKETVKNLQAPMPSSEN